MARVFGSRELRFGVWKHSAPPNLTNNRIGNRLLNHLDFYGANLELWNFRYRVEGGYG